MKVAIIGAGLSGLSCAHELEKYGVRPVIYEKNSYIGEQISHVSAILEIINRPIKDVVKYFKEQFDIDIKPLNTVRTISHHSPNINATIKGNFGYFFKRGNDKDSLKNQLFSSLKNSELVFNHYGDYIELSKKFDYVVIATGDYNFTEELGCWFERVTTYVRGAVVLGDFDINTLNVWINKDYCKNGYAYLTPFDSKRASIALIVTDVNEKEIDYYWDLFWYTEKIRYTIVQEFKLKHKSAQVYPYRVDNIYIAGDAAGIVDPFLGFGQLSSITTGVMAARSIMEGLDYSTLIKDIRDRNNKLLEFRKAFNGATNKEFDMLMAVIGLPGIKQIIYDTPLDVVKLGSAILKRLPIDKKL